ncbi:MAG: hypothetical protein RLY50_1334, partial [Actinomycetota bacterium]
ARRAVVCDGDHEAHSPPRLVLTRCSLDRTVGTERCRPPGGDDRRGVEHAGEGTAGGVEKLVDVGVLGEETHGGVRRRSVGAVHTVQTGARQLERVDHAVQCRLDGDGDVDDVGEFPGGKWNVWVHGADVFSRRPRRHVVDPRPAQTPP